MLQDSCLMVMQDLALLDRSALSAAGPAMDAMRMQATQEVRRRCENVPAQLALREPLPDDRSGKAFLQAFEKLYSTTAFNTRALQSLAAQGALWTTASFLTSRDGVYFGGQEYGGLAQSEFIQATLLAELWSHPGSGGDSDTRLLALCATRNGCSEDPQTAIALAYNGGASLSPETLALAKRIHQAFQSNDVGAFLRPKPSDAAERRPLP
ncbi:hypothetical protein CDL60_00795 [Roseateles noduli]|nr:hypothetical protein CDL60_00795 [Roseateles noduli]